MFITPLLIDGMVKIKQKSCYPVRKVPPQAGYLQLGVLKRVIPFFFVFLWGEAVSSELGESYIPWGDPTYEIIAQLKLQGLFADLSPLSLPYTQGEVAAEIRDALRDLQAGRIKLSPYSLCLLSRLEKEWGVSLPRGELSLSSGLKIAPERKRRPENSLSLTGDVSYAFSPSLLLSQGIRVEWGNWHPSWILVRPWKKDLWGSTPYAYIKWESRGFYLLMGRQALKWGPSPGVSLLLGDNPPSFDQLQWGFKFGRLRFLSFSTSLDDLGGAHRYLSAHRIELRPKRGLNLGLSEVVVYGGKGRQPELCYLNPLTIYYGEQFNHRKDDNILLGGDLSWYFPGGRVYGELLVDDFQYDFHSEPQQIGINGGLDLVRAAGVWLNLEYTRVNNWVYGQNRPWNRYTYRGKVIGWEVGPDADQLSATLLYPLGSHLWTRFTLRVRRKGEGRVDKPQNTVVPWPKSFPSGVVEKNLLVGGEIGYLPRPPLWLMFGFGVERVRNSANVRGKGFTSPRAELQVFYRWKRIEIP